MDCCSIKAGGVAMNEKISAVLVHDRAEHINDLKRILEEFCPVEIKTARTCQEAINEIKQANPPHLVFTDVILPDGTWAELVEQVKQTSAPVNLIVVSRDIDVQLYLNVLEHGAHDFVVAPLSATELVWIVGRAMEDVMRRRGSPTSTIGLAA
jgi:DNA-binding NtrC family response regulator